MRSIRFFLLFYFLTAICFSTLTARADSVIPSLTGSFQGPYAYTPAYGFLFHNQDNSWIDGYWSSPEPANYVDPGNFQYYDVTYCFPGPCNVSWSGDMKGMFVQFQLFDVALNGLTGVVTSGQYSDSIYSDGVSFQDFYESVSYDFVGTWGNGWVGVGSMSSVFQFSCGPDCSPEWNFSGNIVTTTPEPCSFVLVCTGMFGIAGAIRRRVQL